MSSVSREKVKDIILDLRVSDHKLSSGVIALNGIMEEL